MSARRTVRSRWRPRLAGPRSLRRRSLRGVAWVSALLLVVSGLSLSALTAAIDVAPTAIGQPGHTYTETGQPDGPRRNAPIPRAAFELVSPSCPPSVETAVTPIGATGGTVTEITLAGVTYRRHVFTSAGTFTVTDAAPGARIEVLAVGGGGGGGKRHGGGGGAGGLVLATRTVSAGQTFAVVVGDGGQGAGTGSTPTQATSGADSTFGSGDVQLVARGGGFGARFTDQFGADERAGDGGSGGGARSRTGLGTEVGAATQPGVQNRCATLDAGHPGGTASGNWPGGGGGGAGGPGGNVPSQAGGPGLDLSARFGDDVGDEGWFAGGGGGAPFDSGSFAGGQGGGGTGQGSNTAGGAGAAGTGGGGGGARSTSGNADIRGGSGGSGIVIVRYRLLPSAVRDVIAGESETSAVVRWRVPATNPPTADTSYRVERQSVGDDAWTDVTASTTFTTVGSGADRQVRATLPVGTDARHRFRITPLLGAEEGEPTVVESLGKGGSEVQLVGTDVVHVFGTTGGTTTTRTFRLAQDTSIQYVIVGGGGGGGHRHGGGGGAGGILAGTTSVSAANDHSVTVGAGGRGAVATPHPAAAGTGAISGDGSTALGLTAFGGGRGGGGAVTAATGGSGGGSNSSTAGAAGTSGQGRDGAAGRSGTDNWAGGGGGGAGGNGSASPSPMVGGAGGAAASTTIRGTTDWFAGGGGGAGRSGGGAGGSGGGVAVGGAGGSTTSAPAANGQDAVRPGGGGGAGSYNGGGENFAGGRGADGIVILRYAFVDVS